MPKDRGEHTITLQNGKEYRLRFTINVLADIEENPDETRSIWSVLDALQKGNTSTLFSDLRWIVHVALRDQHPEITKEQVGTLIADVGFEAAGAAVSKAFEAMMSKGPRTPATPPARRNRGGTSGQMRSDSGSTRIASGG